jgi:predicted Zn-dependent protease
MAGMNDLASMRAVPGRRCRHPERPEAAGVGSSETETLLRTFATPLFRAAGLDPNLVRIIVIRDDAIDSFEDTGNRMFIRNGSIEKRRAAKVPPE